MSLRYKTMAIILAFYCFSLFLLFSLSNNILISGFIELETHNTEQNVKRVLSTINDTVDIIDSNVSDWAGWDDTYSFINNKDISYVQINIPEQTFYDLKINMMLFINHSGELVYGKAYNFAEQSKMELPNNINEYLYHKEFLWKHVSTTSMVKGIVNLPEGPMMIASRPIITSEKKGPIRGALIMGRYLDDHEVSRIEDLTDIKFSVIKPDDKLSKDLKTFISNASLQNPLYVSHFSDEIINGYSYLNDIRGKPAFIIKTTEPRAIFQKGKENVKYYITYLSLISAFLLIILLVFIEKTILSRLLQLSSSVKLVSEGTSASLNIQNIGNDELTNLTNEIKRMLDSLETSKQTIEHQAYHDSLTGLPNRDFFKTKLDHALKQAKIHNYMVAVLFLDMDRFKVINDSLGHTTGDQILQVVAYRLKKCLRENDIVARLGGDEFTLLLIDIQSIDSPIQVAHRIIDILKEPVEINGLQLYITTSIGISIYPNHGNNADELLKNADIAMYKAKEQGKNNYQLFSADLNDKSVERLEVENNLRQAINNEEFIIYYQLKCDAVSKRITGAEALLRWNHPKHGILTPDRFISIAENTGLIVYLGEWVLREVCRQNKQWQLMGIPPITVSVNLSARQFYLHNIVDFITKTLDDTKLNPEWLELEITESIALQNDNTTIKILKHLKNLGIKISIDDFGTGYSSLSCLTRYPVDKLKIDRSFIWDITNSNNQIVILSIIALGQSLGLGIVAEGVENEEQVEFLLKHQCNEMQGYYFGKPTAPEDFEKLLVNGIT